MSVFAQAIRKAEPEADILFSMHNLGQKCVDQARTTPMHRLKAYQLMRQTQPSMCDFFEKVSGGNPPWGLPLGEETLPRPTAPSSSFEELALS